MKYAVRFTTAAQRQLRAISRPDAMRLLTAVILVVEVGDRRDVYHDR
ncbi:hypothetical protein [Streptomyces olivaceoviridis]